MNYIYKLAKSQKIDESGISHTVYGIEAYEEGSDIPKRIINDIFTDLSAAEQFVCACNMLALDIEHLDDVVYDALNA